MLGGYPEPYLPQTLNFIILWLEFWCFCYQKGLWITRKNITKCKCTFRNNVNRLCRHVLVNGVSVVKERNALRRTGEAFSVRSDWPLVWIFTLHYRLNKKEGDKCRNRRTAYQFATGQWMAPPIYNFPVIFFTFYEPIIGEEDAFFCKSDKLNIYSRLKRANKDTTKTLKVI